MKRKHQMSKNTRQTEKVASGSPYINAVNIPSRPNLQAVVRWKAALQLISMKNIKLNKDECFDNPLKMNAG